MSDNDNRMRNRTDMGSYADSRQGHRTGRDAGAYGNPRPSMYCTAVIGSMTQAMRAQTVLAEAAIRANITKISSSQTHNGCAYGVDFPCTQSGNVRSVLNGAGIRVRQYLQG